MSMYLFASATISQAVNFEWAGIFSTPRTEYLWTAQKVGGLYADPRMRLVLRETADADADTLSSIRDEGIAALNGTCIETRSGEVLAPGRCYDLVFSVHMWQTLFPVQANGVALAIFTQHVPTKFESSAHYLKDADGYDVEPVSEIFASPSTIKAVPWGTGIGAACLVNLLTFAGVLFLVPGMRSLVSKNERLCHATMSAFAAGCLLAAAFYLLLFESTHLIATFSNTESAITFRWGTMVLTGFIFSSVIDAIVIAFLPKETPSSPQTTVPTSTTSCATEQGGVQITVSNGGKGDGQGKGQEPSGDGTADTANALQRASRETRVRVLSGVLIGDFMHNFCDGIFMGVAFRHCSNEMAWSIALATIFHEIAQELSDFLVLTSPLQGGLTPVAALLLNMLSGTSVLWGTIIIFSLDVDDYLVGMLLAFGGGVYVQIGAAECMPKVYESVQNLQERALCLGTFCLGALAIGLVLLDHQHCSAEGAAGHAH